MRAGKVARMTMTILLVLGVAYLGVIALAWFGQGRMIYPVPNPSDAIPSGYDRIEHATPDGLTLFAGYRPASQGMPTLLFFHGNGSSWQSTAMVTETLAAQGYGVMASEYRGYGGNPGTPSEQGLYDDARGAWQWLLEQGVEPGDIALVGNSIGAGVATHLASEVEARALILVSPFDSLHETASRQMRWLPVRMLLRDRYDNASKLPRIAEPVLILHGEADTVIAVEQARTLAASRQDAVIETFPDWGHDLVVNPAVQDRIALFVGSYGTDQRR